MTGPAVSRSAGDRLVGAEQLDGAIDHVGLQGSIGLWRHPRCREPDSVGIPRLRRASAGCPALTEKIFAQNLVVSIGGATKSLGFVAERSASRRSLSSRTPEEARDTGYLPARVRPRPPTTWTDSTTPKDCELRQHQGSRDHIPRMRGHPATAIKLRRMAAAQRRASRKGSRQGRGFLRWVYVAVSPQVPGPAGAVVAGLRGDRLDGCGPARRRGGGPTVS